MTAPATAWLGTCLPPLGATQIYVLLEVGALHRTTESRQPCTVQARFQVRDEGAVDAPDISERLVEWPVSLYRAGVLIPGTRWSAAGFLQSPLPNAIRPAIRTITLGTGRLLARRLHHLFPTADRPAALQSYGLHGWYLAVDTPTERILLPCFEVARAFFYASGHHIISYCLSRLALDRLCWPLVAPSAATHQTAHYCIAALPLRHAEIRLFAELLFTPHCRHTIQRAHARLAHAWAQPAARPERGAPWLRLDWELGRKVRVQVRGEAFLWQGKNYFLVHSLVPAPDWFSFRTVVCHSLRRASDKTSALLFPTPIPVLPIAELLLPTTVVAHREQLAVEEVMAPPQSGTAPAVLHGKCWATASQAVAHGSCYPTAPAIRSYLWEGCPQVAEFFPQHSPASLATRLPGLAQLITHVAPCVEVVEPIELHNPKQVHGQGVSVFPPGSLPSSYTHLPSRQLRPVGVVHLQQGGAHFYLFQLAEDQPPVLMYELRLGVLSLRELEEVLYHVSYVRQDYERIERHLFNLTHQVYVLAQCTDLEPVAVRDWCRAQMRWGICRYNAYRYLLRQPDQAATSFQQLGWQLTAFRLAGRYLERGYLHFPGRAVAELPDAAQF